VKKSRLVERPEQERSPDREAGGDDGYAVHGVACGQRDARFAAGLETMMKSKSERPRWWSRERLANLLMGGLALLLPLAAEAATYWR
jgi:hypothetical protein